MGRKLKATIAAVAMAGTMVLAAPAAEATQVSAAAPCSGRSMPVIFTYVGGWGQFFWWFSTGCKP
jgi:hypothetical protein